MKAADIAVALAVGLCLTGVTVSMIQFLMAWSSRRADQHATRLGLSDKFLDWMTSIVLLKRLDHEPLYSGVVSAIFLVGLFWLLASPLPPWALYALAPQAQIILATCLFLSAGTCLYGVFMGTFMDIWRITARVKRGLLSKELSSPPPLDVRKSYRVGASGIPSVVVGLMYYNTVLWRSTPAVLTGPTTIFLCFTCLGLVIQSLRFLMENRRINAALPMLIEQEVNRQQLANELGTEPDGGASL